MQPIFFSFVSGLHYRKTVKLYFRRISTFYLVVSIYENSSFRRFLSFLTAGNKSKCGTLRRLTDPQQSTAEPILRPVSPPKRQATQGKSFVLSPISTQTSSHLRKHRTSVPSSLQKLTGTVIRTKSAPQATPSHSRTPDAPPMRPQPCPRHFPRRAPLRTHTPPSPQPHPTPKSHVIPPGPRSLAARKPRNINDLISKPETPSGELRAKLLGSARVGPHGGHRAQAATHPDR